MFNCTRILIALLAGSVAATAAAQTVVSDAGVDEASLWVAQIDRGIAISVANFSTAGADMGKAKHQDTAERIADLLPHLLAVDLVEALRDGGFEAGFAEADDESSGLRITGRFTVLDPGSQSARVWIGFGAGKSKVCIEGEVTDGGEKIGGFRDCEGSIGWDSSESEADRLGRHMGSNIAQLFQAWARGL